MPLLLARVTVNHASRVVRGDHFVCTCLFDLSRMRRAGNRESSPAGGDFHDLFHRSEFTHASGLIANRTDTFCPSFPTGSVAPYHLTPTSITSRSSLSSVLWHLGRTLFVVWSTQSRVSSLCTRTERAKEWR